MLKKKGRDMLIMIPSMVKDGTERHPLYSEVLNSIKEDVDQV